RGGRMNRLYVVESTPTITGAMADERLAVPSFQIAALAHSLAGGEKSDRVFGATVRHWLRAVQSDLQNHTGSSIILVGESQHPVVHTLANELNHKLGNVGKTIEFLEPAVHEPTTGIESIRQLANDLNAGAVEVLLILGGNPVYDAPSDVRFGSALDRA